MTLEETPGASLSYRQMMSLDWMRLTPASAICFQAAARDPLRSMARVASSIT